MGKFKVGELVRVKRFDTRPSGWVEDMDQFMGTLCMIQSKTDYDMYFIRGWVFDGEEIEKVNQLSAWAYKIFHRKGANK